MLEAPIFTEKDLLQVSFEVSRSNFFMAVCCYPAINIKAAIETLEQRLKYNQSWYFSDVILLSLLIIDISILVLVHLHFASIFKNVLKFHHVIVHHLNYIFPTDMLNMKNMMFMKKILLIIRSLLSFQQLIVNKRK